MNVNDLTPLHSIEDLKAELAGHDPYLWKAHRDVPLEEGSEMCDDCKFCESECGDGKLMSDG